MSAGDTRLDLLRHGEPVGGSRYRGQVDDPLSELGWAQMRSAVQELSGWQQVVTSPLSRCHKFAQEVSTQRGIPVTVEPRFAEVGFGDWEGFSRAELEADDPDQVRLFYEDPVRHRPNGAEPLDDFIGRVAAGLETVLEQHAGQSVLVVAHAGVIRAIMATVLDMSPVAIYRIHVANAGITRLRTDRQRRFRFETHGA